MSSWVSSECEAAATGFALANDVLLWISRAVVWVSIVPWSAWYSLLEDKWVRRVVVELTELSFWVVGSVPGVCRLPPGTV